MSPWLLPRSPRISVSPPPSTLRGTALSVLPKVVSKCWITLYRLSLLAYWSFTIAKHEIIFHINFQLPQFSCHWLIWGKISESWETSCSCITIQLNSVPVLSSSRRRRWTRTCWARLSPTRAAPGRRPSGKRTSTGPPGGAILTVCRTTLKNK